MAIHFMPDEVLAMITTQKERPINKTDLAVRIVLEMIRDSREVTVGHIKALPFIRTETDVDEVVDHLIRHHNLEIVQEKVESEPILRWERFIRMKT